MEAQKFLILVSCLLVTFRHGFANHLAITQSACSMQMSKLLVYATANVLKPESSTFLPTFILENWDF